MSHQGKLQLSTYDNSWYRPGPLWKRTLWFFVADPVFRSILLPGSALRVAILRLFGARMGEGVVIKPGVRIKYPWFLEVGNHTWIGESSWIDNLTTVRIGSNVCISQGAYLCTGNHDWKDPSFGLRISPITCNDGSWAGANSTLTPGVSLGEGAVAAAGAVVFNSIPDFEIHAGNPAAFVRRRVIRTANSTVDTYEEVAS